MNFSWLDFEVTKLYREACVKEAHYRRLIRNRDLNEYQRNHFMVSKMTRIREWLERQGWNLQGLEHQETSVLGPGGASYE